MKVVLGQLAHTHRHLEGAFPRFGITQAGSNKIESTRCSNLTYVQLCHFARISMYDHVPGGFLVQVGPVKEMLVRIKTIQSVAHVETGMMEFLHCLHQE